MTKSVIQQNTQPTPASSLAVADSAENGGYPTATIQNTTFDKNTNIENDAGNNRNSSSRLSITVEGEEGQKHPSTPGEAQGEVVVPPPVVVAASCVSFALKFSLGQLLAFTVSITGVFTTLLVEDNSSISTLQCIASYGFIVLVTALVYFPLIVWRRSVVNAAYKRLTPSASTSDDDGDSTSTRSINNNNTPITSTQPHTSSITSSAGREVYPSEGGEDAPTSTTPSSTTATGSIILKSYRGVGCQIWRFAGIAVVDVAANFTVVLAYAHTDMTSVQLLDCSSILWVMGLSYLLLKNVRYKVLWHIVGALLSVVGLVLLIVMDADGMSRTDGGKHTKGDVILGDILCLVSALFYALSNVLSERVVRDSCGINGVQNDTAVTNANAQAPPPSAENTAAISVYDSRQHEQTAAPNPNTSSPSSQQRPHRSCKETTPLLLNRICPDHDEEEEARMALKEEEAEGVSSILGRHRWILPSSHSSPPPLKFVVIVEYLFWMALSGLILSTLLFFILQDYTKFASYNEYHSTTPSSSSSSSASSNISSGLAPSLHHHRSSSTHQLLHQQHFTNTSGGNNNNSYPPMGPQYAYQREYDGTSTVDLYYTIGYGLSMVTVYTLMPVLFIVASATFANLSLLTADIYSVIWNVAVFGIYPKYSFLASFVIIVLGVVVFDTNGFFEIRKALKKRRALSRGGSAAASVDVTQP